MTARAAQVFLHQQSVGSLIEDDQGFIQFRISEAFHRDPHAAILGQWFVDHPETHPRGARPGDLPTFFENLIPEGDLRLLLEERLRVRPGDDLALLCAVGGDLPGAVIVQLQEGDAPAAVPRRSSDETDSGMRFSLAGVQLKFSMVRSGERFVMPGSDSRGEWIAKIALDAYAELCANEWVTMEWARNAGFDVPRTELRTLADLVDVPHHGNAAAPVFVIQRYDRKAEGQRVHQEDFQQIVGRRAAGKYDDVTYEGLTLLATRICDEAAHQEMLRRLAFMVASGNSDAHMKNWSVIYPHGSSRAELSPLYDQVFTAQWPQFAEKLALKLGGTKEFAAITLDRFRELARRVGQSPEQAVTVVSEAIAQIADAWDDLRAHPAVSAEYREALHRHWRKVPLLQPHATRLS
jgi:serine/threonine-protein kinase HipA